MNLTGLWHTLNQWFSDLDGHFSCLEAMLNRLLPTPLQCFSLGRLEGSLRICIFKKFSGGADAASPEITL